MRRVLPTLTLLAFAATARAQQPYAPAALTAADYARAERFLAANASQLMTGVGLRFTALPDGRFSTRLGTAAAPQYLLIDPVKRTAELSPAQASPKAVSPNEILSPDGKQAAFIRAHNLWVRDIASGAETQLTTDGVEDFGYATNNAGWERSDRPVLLWSPDSRRIATFQHDARGVGMMYLTSTNVGHPTLTAWKYPLPGDSLIFRIERVVIDVAARKVVRLRMAPDAHRSTVCDHVVCGSDDWTDVEWTPDAAQLAFVSSSRDHKVATLRLADPTTGAVRTVLEERVATQYESGLDKANWHVLPATKEVIWFSERSNWGQLYMHDLTTGRVKYAITTGMGPVLQLLRVDEKERVAYFTASGREAGRDPYFRHLYSVRLDGKNLKLLTPENADHDVTLAADGRSFIDNYSTPTTPPVSVLRDMNGKVLTEVHRADISKLVAAGWTPPIPFTVKARDGRTDLYGLLYRPAQFDSTKKYPIINRVYPGPQTGSVGSRSFSARGDQRALAELGFIVVEIDAMGTPMRSKSFHDAYYGNMGDNGLPDQVAGMKQLAERYSWIDIDRAGIYGHSGGGFASTGGILRYPDFFKVAVSQAGNHDNRNYEDDWGERYHGLLAGNNYVDQANQSHVQNLKGRLLLAHGTTDDNVPPSNTMLMVNELIKANKDFDLILFPNRAHGFGGEPYMVRRRWDYFVKNLMGAEPPKEYAIGGAPR